MTVPKKTTLAQSGGDTKVVEARVISLWFCASVMKNTSLLLIHIENAKGTSSIRLPFAGRPPRTEAPCVGGLRPCG
jgi:hypothetical protein